VKFDKKYDPNIEENRKSVQIKRTFDDIFINIPR